MTQFSKAFRSAGASSRYVWDNAKAPAVVDPIDTVLEPIASSNFSQSVLCGFAEYTGGLYILANSSTSYRTAPNLTSAWTFRSGPFSGSATGRLAGASFQRTNAFSLVAGEAGSSNFFGIARTTDGINWSTSQTGLSSVVGTTNRLCSLRYDKAPAGSDRIFLTHAGNTTYYEGMDGTNWFARTAPSPVNDVIWLNQWVFATNAGIYTSNDLTNYTLRHTYGGYNCASVVKVGTRLIALFSGTGNNDYRKFCRFAYSDDSGLTWTNGAMWQALEASDLGGLGGYTFNNAPLCIAHGSSQVEYVSPCVVENSGFCIVKCVSTMAAYYNGTSAVTPLENSLVVTPDGVNLYVYKTGAGRTADGNRTYGGYVSVANGQFILSDPSSGNCVLNFSARELAIEL